MGFPTISHTPIQNNDKKNSVLGVVITQRYKFDLHITELDSFPSTTYVLMIPTNNDPNK